MKKKKKYIKPLIEIIKVKLNNFLWNSVGNFGPGDKDDDDR